MRNDKGKISKIVIVFIVVIGAGLFFITNLFREKVGDIRPALLPAQRAQQSTTDVSSKSTVPVTLPEGFIITYFSKGTPGARDLQISPGGVILVSLPGEGRIVTLPDRNNDGSADEVKTVLEGLDRPHGLAFADNMLFVAEESQVSRYKWDENSLAATFDRKLFDLPSGGRHFTRSLAIEKDGTLYVSIGSTCDTCFEKNPLIAGVIISNTEGKEPQVFAKGLRNSVFIKLDSQEKLWGTEMGRDFLGDNLPPDEVNVIRGPSASSGQKPSTVFDFGWPVCYGNKVYDNKFGQRDPSYCNNTVAPVFNLPAHVAPLGLTFVNSPAFPDDWQGDLLVGLHGSWNSSVPVGYKVVRLQVEGDDKVTGMQDFITGFTRDGQARLPATERSDGGQVTGRPVDVEFGLDGSLFISDDKAGVVYRIISNQ